MQVDPRLERLQSLIEQKRAQQSPGASNSVVGKAGNPRFAAAAARVRQARSGSLPQTTSNSSRPVESTLQQIQNKQPTERLFSTNRIGSSDDSLLTGASAERTLSVREKPSLSANPPHLGRNLDTYA